MCHSVYKFYISSEGWGRFNSYLHRIVNTYRDVEVKAKLYDEYISIVLKKGTEIHGFVISFKAYTAMIEALKNNNYSALILRQFQHGLQSFIWDAFYNPKYI